MYIHYIYSNILYLLLYLYIHLIKTDCKYYPEFDVQAYHRLLQIEFRGTYSGTGPKSK
jgi:hypothetical protein